MPVIRIRFVALPAFQLCGLFGLALAVALTWSLAALSGLSLWIMALITLTFVTSFFVLALLTTIVTGVETLVYYRHLLVFLAATVLLLRLRDQPLLPYLDVTIVGTGAFVLCGRIGCLLAGCCYGQPHRWGVCYGSAHVAACFEPWLINVPLLPTPLFEALLVGGITLVNCVLILLHSKAGTALAWYIVVYALGRFALEFWRGDAERPYIGGFSEAQWTSLLVLSGMVTLELAGRVPMQRWHLTAAVGMLLAMIGVWLWRRGNGPPIWHPRSIRDLALTLATLDCPTGDQVAFGTIPPTTTWLGLHLSHTTVDEASGRVHHYAVSRTGDPLTGRLVTAIVRLIVYLRHPDGHPAVVEGDHGIVHILIR